VRGRVKVRVSLHYPLCAADLPQLQIHCYEAVDFDGMVRVSIT
jgi:hypothetical protein